MEYRNLEIQVSSAKDLKDVNMFSKMDVYVVVMVAEDPRTKQKTPVDKNGGKSPKWNHKMEFVVDEAAAKQSRSTLVFQIKSDRVLGDRDIGEVFVPVKELLENDGEVDDAMKTERSVSYSVRTPSGKAKGTLNISFKFGDKVDAAAAGAANFSEKKLGDEPVMAYPTGPSYGYQPPPGAAPMYHPPPHRAAPMYPPLPHRAGQMYLPPPQGAGQIYPPPGAAYMYPPPAEGYPAPNAAGTYPPHGYSQPHMAPGYGGYPPQQAAGYGHPAQVAEQPKKKKGGMGMGMGLGLGLGAGLLGGLLVGEVVSDVGEMASDIGEIATYDVMDAIF